MRLKPNWLLGLALMALVWVFLSPWVVHPFDFNYAIDAWMTSTVTLLIVMSAMREPWPAAASLVSGVLGVWLVVSAWALDFSTKVGPSLDAWIFGGIVAILSFMAMALRLRESRSETASA